MWLAALSRCVWPGASLITAWIVFGSCPEKTKLAWPGGGDPLLSLVQALEIGRLGRPGYLSGSKSCSDRLPFFVGHASNQSVSTLSFIQAESTTKDPMPARHKTSDFFRLCLGINFCQACKAGSQPNRPYIS